MFAYAKTKAQISFAVTAKLISAFVFATWIVKLVVFLNPKFQASSLLLRSDTNRPVQSQNFCDCTGRFVSDLVGNPENQYSCCVVAHIFLCPLPMLQGEHLSVSGGRNAHFVLVICLRRPSEE